MQRIKEMNRMATVLVIVCMAFIAATVIASLIGGGL
jgi:hypothetical protein